MNRLNMACAQQRRSGDRRERGVAMVLVLVAVTVALITGLGFVLAQSTASQIATNFDAEPRARCIAQSALAFAVAQVRSDDDWRTNHNSGSWAVNQSLNGGTFTLTGVDADGDLDDDDTDSVTLTATGRYDGVTHTASVVLTPSGSDGAGPPNLLSLVLQADVDMKNSAAIDSWDSSLGAYGASNSGSSAHVITNATGSNKVTLANTAQIKGNVVVGAGGTPDDVIDAGGSSLITGAQTAASGDTAIVMPSAPDLGASAGNKIYSTSTTISSSMRVGKLEIKSSAVVTISGNVTLVVDDEFKMTNTAQLQLTSGSTLTIYAKAKVTLSDTTRVNTTTADPTAVKLYALDDEDKVTLQNTAIVYAQVQSAAEMQLKNSAELYGTFMGGKITMQNSSRFHQDLRSLDESSDEGGSGDEVTYESVWVESP